MKLHILPSILHRICGVALLFALLLVNGLPALAQSAPDAEGQQTPQQLHLPIVTGGESPEQVVQIAASPNIVISQVYGGGGNSGAQFTHDFIELFNRGNASVPLAGWSVQYASATGTGAFGATTTQLTELPNISLAPGQYLLIQEAGGTTGLPLPTPDVTDASPIAMAAGAGKVALVSSTASLGCNGGSTPCNPTQLAQIIDLVGYGNANFAELTTAPAPAPTLTNSTAALRNGNGCTDTDNNFADFTVGPPAPRNFNSPLAPCGGNPSPTVASTDPGTNETGVATDSNIVITFSEDVTVLEGWFEISCVTSGPLTASVSGAGNSRTLNPDLDFSPGESCTVTLVASLITDQDDAPMAANYSWSFTTSNFGVCGADATPIHTIQGAGLESLMDGDTVVVEAVVIGDYQGSGGLGGFFLQEEDLLEEQGGKDNDPQTSEGIFVFTGSAPRAVILGNIIRLEATVDEFDRGAPGAPLTELTNITRLDDCGPSPDELEAATMEMPVDSLDDWEQVEGMLVTIPQVLTVTENFTLGRFGEVHLSANGRLYTPTHLVEPGADAQEQQALNNLNRILLDDGLSIQNPDPVIYPEGYLSAANTLRSGDTVDGLTGILTYDFDLYRIQPLVPVAFERSNQRPPEPAEVGGTLTVAAANVLNYFTTLDTDANDNNDPADPCGPDGGLDCRGADNAEEFQRQRAKIIAGLSGIDADIVGLIELENNASASIQSLVNGLNAELGAGTYAFIDTDTIGTDAIKVGIIYKPLSVTPLGDPAILTSDVDPLFVDTLNRPALAQTFQDATGEIFTIAVNHLKSKGSACPGDPDTGDGQGNCNITRTNAAKALIDWLATDPTGSGDPDFLIVGDLNSYAKEDPIDVITAPVGPTSPNSGYTDLIAAYSEALGDTATKAYSYVFDGQSGYLDHALASPSLRGQVTGATEWHTNADEPIALDYNTEFKSDAQDVTFYAADAYRFADHDPLVVGLNLDSAGPVASPTQSPAANGAGWNNSDVTVTWNWSDGGGIDAANCTTSSTSTGEGEPITLTASCRDLAGNEGTASYTVNVDKTAPVVTVEGVSDGASYPYGSVLAPTCNTEDVLSGVASAAMVSVTGGNGDGTGNFTATCSSATDNAGNSSDPVSVSYTVSPPGMLVGSCGGYTVYRDGNSYIALGWSGAIKVGTNSNNTLTGNNGPDLILGLGGNDLITGNGGDDVACGGNGVDLLLGLNGNDVLDGGEGNDVLNGGNGDYDQLLAAGGNDTLLDGDGVLTAQGGTGNDLFTLALRNGWRDVNNQPRFAGLAAGYGNDTAVLLILNLARFTVDITGDERDNPPSPQEGSNDNLALAGVIDRASTIIKFENRLVISADAEQEIPSPEAGAEYLAEPVGDGTDQIGPSNQLFLPRLDQ